MPTMSDIEMAFDYVGGGSYGMNSAVYSRKDDRFYYASDLLGESDIPEDIDDQDSVDVPHKNDLDLGRELVYRFVQDRLPEESEAVYLYFGRPGAYARLKDLLESRGLLEEWYKAEAEAQREAILEWCSENGIEITGGANCAT